MSRHVSLKALRAAHTVYEPEEPSRRSHGVLIAAVVCTALWIGLAWLFGWLE